ncbi:MAG: hypothetical protein U0840_14750 [Gemmataceae bacterium]
MRFFFIPEGPELLLIGGGVALAIVVVALIQWLRPPVIQKLMNDPRYLEAMAIYTSQLPALEDSTAEQRGAAREQAVLQLTQSHGIPVEEANRNMHIIEGEYLKQRSYELRQEAIAFEQGGLYPMALEQYERAAELRRGHDAEDHDFLQRCIDRVRRKLG